VSAWQLLTTLSGSWLVAAPLLSLLLVNVALFVDEWLDQDDEW